jgi:hypothetical protein
MVKLAFSPIFHEKLDFCRFVFPLLHEVDSNYHCSHQVDAALTYYTLLCTDGCDGAASMEHITPCQADACTAATAASYAPNSRVIAHRTHRAVQGYILTLATTDASPRTPPPPQKHRYLRPATLTLSPVAAQERCCGGRAQALSD